MVSRPVAEENKEINASKQIVQLNPPVSKALTTEENREEHDPSTLSSPKSPKQAMEENGGNGPALTVSIKPKKPEELNEEVKKCFDT